MALNKYWVRSSFLLGPSSTQPLNDAQYLGGVQANRQPEDVLLRTRFWTKVRFAVTNTTPPSILTWPKLYIATWAEYRTNGDAGIGSWPDGIIDMIGGDLPNPEFWPASADHLTYNVLWATKPWVDVKTMRTGRAVEGNFPGVNMAVQVFDETGQTFPPARFTQNLEYYCTIETLWGSAI